MWRSRGQTVTTGHARTPLELETMTIATYAGNIAVLKKFMEAAILDQFEEEGDETNIFVLSDGWAGGWEKAMTKPRRSKESIVLDDDLSEKLISDAKKFLESSQWYGDRGIPYRRGYLLHGPPGCGKTSFTQVLAGALKLDMCMLSLSNAQLDDQKLAQNFREAPENAIILLEDVDAVFVDRDVQKKGKGSGGTGVSFSGLLNAIDGVASQEGRLFFMTTNYPEKLDSALVRPGRCDVKEELRCASRNQMARLFLRFFPHSNLIEAKKFASMLPEFELSMAQLQGHLLEYRDSAENAVNKVNEFLSASKPQQVKKMTIYDHLKRVGLERLAPLFEMHGYKYQSDLHGLDVKTVAEWDVELQYDYLQCQRLKRLLEEEKKLMDEEYPLASIATIRDAFFAAYPIQSMQILEAQKEEEEEEEVKEEKQMTLTPPPTLLRQTSYEQQTKRCPGTAVTLTTKGKHPMSPRTRSLTINITTKLDGLAKSLAGKLSRDGKGDVSLWQLRWLLAQNPYPEYAVANASSLTSSRADSTRVHTPMSMYSWLKRAGLNKLWHTFEDAGYKWAYELKSGLKAVKDVKALVKSNDAAFLFRLIQNDAKDRNTTCGLLHPDRERVRHLYRLAWPQCTHDQAHQFAQLLTNKCGYGKCSVRQLTQYLFQPGNGNGIAEEINKDMKDMKEMLKTKSKTSKSFSELTGKGRCHKSAQEAIDGCLIALIHIKKNPRPPTPSKSRPSSWIHKTLDALDSSFSPLSKHFIDNGLSKKDDIIIDPPLMDADLEKLGIGKLGHRRAILRWFERLRKGQDDGVLIVGNRVKCDFGIGKVVDYREKDDVYQIQMKWGSIVYGFEEALNVERLLVDEEEEEKEKENEKEEEKVDNGERLLEVDEEEEESDTLVVEEQKIVVKEDGSKYTKKKITSSKKKKTQKHKDNNKKTQSPNTSCKKEFPSL